MSSAFRLIISCGLLSLLLACDQPGGDYYPLAVGDWWQYGISVRTMDGTQESKQIIRNVGQRMEAGQTVYYRQTTSGQQSRYIVSDMGIQRTAVSNNRDGQHASFTSMVLGYPLSTDTQWTGNIITSVLEKTGPPQDTLFQIRERVLMNYRITSIDDTVQINGISYERCVRVHGSGSVNADVANYIGRISIVVESDDWYAPGIGLVKSRHNEITDNETIPGGQYRLELEYYNRL